MGTHLLHPWEAGGGGGMGGSGRNAPAGLPHPRCMEEGWAGVGDPWKVLIPGRMGRSASPLWVEGALPGVSLEVTHLPILF